MCYKCGFEQCRIYNPSSDTLEHRVSVLETNVKTLIEFVNRQDSKVNKLLDRIEDESRPSSNAGTLVKKD